MDRVLGWRGAEPAGSGWWRRIDGARLLPASPDPAGGGAFLVLALPGIGSGVAASAVADPEANGLVPLLVLTLLVALLAVARLWVVTRRLRAAVGQRERLALELHEQATHDPLTGLLNDRAFRAAVTRLLAEGSSGALFLVDLDDFTAVNETFARQAGDRLLVEVGRRLLLWRRSGDLVARLEADEFAVFLVGIDGVGAARRAAERLLPELHAPVLGFPEPILPRASLGVALATRGISVDELLRQTEVALRLAKGSGKGQIQLYAPGLDIDERDRHALTIELQAAIAAGELFLEYQPIVDLADGRIVAVEALVRWRHRQRGVLPPGAFIAVAEASGLVVPLGRWVLETACRQGREWLARGWVPQLRIAVNLSLVQLRAPDLVADLRRILRRTGLPPERLILEMTESAALDRRQGADRLAQLRRLGVGLAIDDFGTGYASLDLLGQLEADVVKVDRSFIAGLGRDPRASVVLEHLLRLVGELGMVAVAEGIETVDQMAELRRLGCRLGQGFLLARPASAAACEDLLAAGRIDDARRAAVPARRPERRRRASPLSAPS
jgi:diguanylate cyclase (GGDEF)-like protein